LKEEKSLNDLSDSNLNNNNDDRIISVPNADEAHTASIRINNVDSNNKCDSSNAAITNGTSTVANTDSVGGLIATMSESSTLKGTSVSVMSAAVSARDGDMSQSVTSVSSLAVPVDSSSPASEAVKAPLCDAEDVNTSKDPYPVEVICLKVIMICLCLPHVAVVACIVHAGLASEFLKCSSRVWDLLW